MAEFGIDDIDSVSEKLSTFAEGLSEEEKAVMQLLLAEAVSDDVSGFDFNQFALDPSATTFSFDQQKLSGAIQGRFECEHNRGWHLVLGSGGSSIGGRQF
ncbi:MAG: hypothetical protein U5K30_16100 [Acidimicrobiales bacterium]|nr:hypothetical protein [Acidimicrobiales bacterium]